MNAKHYLTLIIILLSGFSIHAQSSSDTISMKKNGLGFYYYKNNEPITFKQVMNETAFNNEAYRLMTKSKNLRFVGHIFEASGAFVTGFAVGYFLGEKMLGKTDVRGNPVIRTEIIYPLLAGGAFLIVVGLSFEGFAGSYAEKGIAVYNRSVKQKHPQTRDLGISANGIMLRLNF